MKSTLYIKNGKVRLARYVKYVLVGYCLPDDYPASFHVNLPCIDAISDASPGYSLAISGVTGGTCDEASGSYRRTGGIVCDEPAGTIVNLDCPPTGWSLTAIGNPPQPHFVLSAVAGTLPEYVCESAGSCHRVYSESKSGGVPFSIPSFEADLNAAAYSYGEALLFTSDPFEIVTGVYASLYIYLNCNLNVFSVVVDMSASYKTTGCDEGFHPDNYGPQHFECFIDGVTWDENCFPSGSHSVGLYLLLNSEGTKACWAECEAGDDLTCDDEEISPLARDSGDYFPYSECWITSGYNMTITLTAI